jgi:hypothetical protein
VRWVEFAITRDDRLALADPDQPLVLAVSAGAENLESRPLPAPVRTSLLADLSSALPIFIFRSFAAGSPRTA